MENFENIKSILESASVDADKFYNKNNKVAGTRLRKAMQDIKILAQDVRKDVQSRKNG